MDQGKTIEAKGMDMRMRKGYEKIYDVDHPRVSVVKSNLSL